MTDRTNGTARERPSAVCLFSSAGIGELGLEAAGLEIIVASELLPHRMDLYRENFPETATLTGDIWELRDQIVEQSRSLLDGRELFLLYATPPCQGMSSNGAGKLRSEIAAGRRDVEDDRNRLIIPTMSIAELLRPRFLLLENVPQMRNTVIRNEEGAAESLLGFVRRRLGPDYEGGAEVLSCEEFGIPQRRNRLITIFTRDPAAAEYFRRNGNSLIDNDMRSGPTTLKQAIGHLPPLDASEGNNEATWFHPQHRVPVMNPRKYWWISHTREGDTAFNNPCVNPSCLSTATPGHTEAQIEGRWRSKDTPIYCIDCGELLPRPSVETPEGALRPLRGFHSAYRRMRADQPARTLTQNFIYEASDNKVHPEQNRVLSVYEAMILQSIDRYSYRFKVNNQDIGIPRIAEVIGESVAPYLIEKLARKMLDLAGREGDTRREIDLRPIKVEAN